MSGAVFFWYVLPYVIAAGVFGWLIYDRHKRSNLHPGE
jgi:hypothetical protein